MAPAARSPNLTECLAEALSSEPRKASAEGNYHARSRKPAAQERSMNADGRFELATWGDAAQLDDLPDRRITLADERGRLAGLAPGETLLTPSSFEDARV